MRKEREINIDLKNLKEEDTTKIEDVYVNKYNQVVEDDNKPFSSLNRKFTYMPFSSLGGVRPYSREEMTQTTTRNFNKNIEKIFNDNSYKESFNQAIKEREQEVAYLKKNNKTDHIKKIFSTLNFKAKNTTYNEAHEFDNSKKKETLDHDFSNHYKKSFMKTYEENRIKHKIIIRK